MNKQFCIACGHKNLFEISKPKFCAGCGSPFNTSLASVKTVAAEEELAEHNESRVSYDLQKLKNTIISESSANKKTLDDLWKDPAPRSNQGREPSLDPSGNEIIKKTMNECAMVKKAEEING